MRFMLLIKTDPATEAGFAPDPDAVVEMSKFNDSLIDAGVLLTAEGLHPTSKGKKVKTVHGKRTIVDGPFTESKELLAGFWLIDVKSLDEAVEWASRVPVNRTDEEGNGAYGEIEVRQVFELSEFEAPEYDTPGIQEALEGERKYRASREGNSYGG